MEAATAAPPTEKMRSQIEVLAAQKPVEPSPSTQDQGQSRKKRKSKWKAPRKGTGKIHIRLPSIEAYQKEICFPAEAPGRVVVRLERLMGSDKIRPVDGKYMETLIQRLEEEEFLAWERKIRLRKKAEKERHRQLAINGLMEPGPGMEDLYNHPVFRVNRILNRLSKLDNAFVTKPGSRFPPISQIDPFKFDDSGKYFCDYPTHVALRKECEKYHDEAENDDQLGEEEGDDSLAGAYSTKSYVDFVHKNAKTRSTVMTAAPPPSEASVAVRKEEEDESETDDEVDGRTTTEEGDGEGEELTEMEEMALSLNKEYMQSLTTLQDRYGIPVTSEFEEMWKPYRSEIVDSFFNDPDSMDKVYSSAREIIEVYTRQDIMTRDHIKQNPIKVVEIKKSDPKITQDEQSEGEGVSIDSGLSQTEEESEGDGQEAANESEEPATAVEVEAEVTIEPAEPIAGETETDATAEDAPAEPTED